MLRLNHYTLWTNYVRLASFGGSRPHNLSMYLSIYVLIYASIYLSIYLSIYQSIYLSIYLSINLFIYQSIYLSLFLSISLSVFLSQPPKIRNAVKSFLDASGKRALAETHWKSAKYHQIVSCLCLSLCLEESIYSSILIYLPQLSNNFHTATLKLFS